LFLRRGMGKNPIFGLAPTSARDGVA